MTAYEALYSPEREEIPTDFQDTKEIPLLSPLLLLLRLLLLLHQSKSANFTRFVWILITSCVSYGQMIQQSGSRRIQID